ncbi:hypothetical protein [Halalkalicoccus salilacus]
MSDPEEDHEDADPMALAQTAFKNAVATIEAPDDHDPDRRIGRGRGGDR